MTLWEEKGAAFHFPSFPSLLCLLCLSLLWRSCFSSRPIRLKSPVPLQATTLQEHMLARSLWAPGQLLERLVCALLPSFLVAQWWRLLWAEKGHVLLVACKPHITYSHPWKTGSRTCRQHSPVVASEQPVFRGILYEFLSSIRMSNPLWSQLGLWPSAHPVTVSSKDVNSKLYPGEEAHPFVGPQLFCQSVSVGLVCRVVNTEL